MIRYSFRNIIIVIILFVIALSFTIFFSPTIPNNIGILQYQSVSGDGFHYHYVDYDTGIDVHTMTPLEQLTVLESYPIINSNSLEQTLIINSANNSNIFSETIINTYPPEPRFEWATWYEVNQTVLVVYRDNSHTGLALIDIDTGDLNHYLTIDNFSAGLISLSPDNQYLLLRETETNFTTSSPPQANYLVNLETASITGLGTLIYAYWSPDSSKIVMGHPTTRRGELTVEIYDIANASIQILGVTIARSDISFFSESANAFVTAVLWSPDSQTLMVHSRANQDLTHIDITGNILSTYDGGRLLPNYWSPDGRYLLTVGYYENIAGAFIVDTQAQARIRLDSDIVIQASLADFKWSEDSQFIAVMTRTSGFNQTLQLAIYSLDGQAIIPASIINTLDNSFVLHNSITWVQ